MSGKVMKKAKLKNGVFEVEVTLYRTGNIHIKLTNLFLKTTKIIQTKREIDVGGYVT